MSEQFYIKKCSNCGRVGRYSVNHLTCIKCNSNLVLTLLSEDDFSVFCKLVPDDGHFDDFVNAMADLKDKDPIEFQLKMSQFRASVAQQKSSSQNNVPKCPTCGSTNIQKISGLSKAGSVALWGIFSRKVHKQWHCDSCGSEW